MGAVYLPSEFGIVFLPLANVQVKAGDKLRVTCRYSHRGKTESQTLYAAMGNSGWAGFDEVLNASKTRRSTPLWVTRAGPASTRC